jgi:hypothetical protein
MNDLKKLFIRLNALNDSLIPSANNASAMIHDKSSWDGFNSTLDELAELTKDNHYLSLKIQPIHMGTIHYILTSNFSSKVYQAVNYLFETQKQTNLREDCAPQRPKASDGGSISQTVHQAQDNAQSQITEVSIEFNQTLTYMTEVIVEAKVKYPEGSKERTFLDKLKDGISTAKTTADLIKMIMTLAIQLGITTEVLGEIFK